MASKSIFNKPVGVIGAGSFGLSVANLLAENTNVLLYARNSEVVEEINSLKIYDGFEIHANIKAINNIKELAESCDIIFPVVPSANFREMIQTLSPYLNPYHILIHGTKGLELSLASGKTLADYKVLERRHIRTMSEVIRDESVVVRVGCLAGPNLSQRNKPKTTSRYSNCQSF